METKQAAVVPVASAAIMMVAPDTGDVLSRLERLQTLLSSGAITQAEADSLKRSILA